MKLGITGSRTITEFDFVPYFTMQDKGFRTFCRKYGLGRRKITAVITGGAKGVDTIAYQTAEMLKIKNLQYLPDHKKYQGKLIVKAYQARNRQIVESCDVLLAVWNGSSHGTKNTLTLAYKMHKPVFLLTEPER